jgi:hypothetical protein
MSRLSWLARPAARFDTWGLAIVCWLAAGLGCAPPPATAVAVSVKTDLLLGSDLSKVTYRVFAETSDPDVDLPVAEYTIDAQDLSMPFVVTQRHAEAFLLSVEGVGPSSLEPVVVARERVQFEREKTLALHVFLARACYRKRCVFAGLTCFGEGRGSTPAGQCDAVPGPRVLDEVEHPGNESNWEPMPGPGPIDASRPQLPTLPPPRVDGGGCAARRDAGVCAEGPCCR